MSHSTTSNLVFLTGKRRLMHGTIDQNALIKSCKGLGQNGSISLIVPLRMENGKLIGRLRPVDATIASEPRTAEEFAQWRRSNYGAFLSEFEATVERTRNWLNDIVVPSLDRMMFVIEDETERRVGHFGIANIEMKTIELDNGIRGESGGHPKLFNYVELYVCHFAFSYLGVEAVKVRVFADNMSARRLHRTIGFVERKREDLVRTQVSEGEFHYKPVEDHDKSKDEVRQVVHLEMSRNIFYSRYQWLRSVMLP